MKRPISVVIALAVIGGAPTAAAQSAEACGVMLSADGSMRTEPAGGYVITGAVLPLRLPEGHTNVVALVCDRATLTIGDNDYRVPTDLEIPLFVRSDDRILVLEMINGQFRIQVVEGDLTDDEAIGIQIALDRAQSLVQGETN